MKRYLHLNPFMLTNSGTPFPECKRIIKKQRDKREINLYLQINNLIPLEKVTQNRYESTSEISYACMIKESDKLFAVICKSEPV